MRGLVNCGLCGATYVYVTRKRPSGAVAAYDRCRAQLIPARHNSQPRCPAIMIRARGIERIVWQKCRSLIENPEEAIALWPQRIQERQAQSTRIEVEKQNLQKALAAKESERERVMTLFRRGLISFDDVEGQLEAISKEAAQLQAFLAAHQAQAHLTAAVAEDYHTTVELLQTYQAALEDIEDREDLVQKRAIIARLIPRIVIDTQGAGRQKVAAFRAYFRSDHGGVSPLDSAADFELTYVK